MEERIKLKSLPKISFAHVYSSSDEYVNYLPPNSGFLEISYAKVGKLKFRQGNDSGTMGDGEVIVQIRNDGVEVVAEGVFEIHCVGLCAEFDYLFPKQTIIMANADGKNDKLLSLIDEIIAVYNLYPNNHAKQNAVVFTLIDALNERYDEQTRKEVGVPGEITYVNKIKTFVIKNAHKKIRLSDIAETLHISESYLCIVFKKVTGESVVSFINKYKLGVIKNLIVSKKLSLKEACSAVGIADPAYASRLFKKYENQSLREFKCSVINKP